MPAPNNRRAVVTTGPGTVSVQTVPTPSPGSGELLVRTVAVGLNPTDWKTLALYPATGAIVGVDFSGIVETVGSNVSKFSVGDRVAGFVHGSVASNHEYGAFTEYVLAFEHLMTHLPDNMSFEQGATLGVGITTVGQAFAQTLHLPLPSLERGSVDRADDVLLIYGGQSATGNLAIQLAVMAGVRVITTCSPVGFAKVEALGAEKAFDYKDENCSKKIRAYTSNSLSMIFDCISQASTISLSVDAMSSDGGTIVTTLKPQADFRTYPKVKIIPILSYTAVGKSFRKGDSSDETPARPEDRTSAGIWWENMGPILHSGKLKLSDIVVQEGELEGISNGLRIGSSGANGAGRGGKMVYRVQSIS